jgi:hypothetical protein
MSYFRNSLNLSSRVVAILEMASLATGHLSVDLFANQPNTVVQADAKEQHDENS